MIQQFVNGTKRCLPRNLSVICKFPIEILIVFIFAMMEMNDTIMFNPNLTAMKKNTLTSIYKELSALCEESFASDTDRFSFTLAGGVLLGDRNPDYTTYSLYRRHFF